MKWRKNLHVVAMSIGNIMVLSYCLHHISPCRFCRTLNRFRSPFVAVRQRPGFSLHEERCLCRVRRPRRVIRRCKRMKKYSKVEMVQYWLYYWVYHILLEGLNYVLYFSIVSICLNSWLQWMWTCELITHYPGLAQPDVQPLALASGNFILCYAKITIKKKSYPVFIAHVSHNYSNH